MGYSWWLVPIVVGAAVGSVTSVINHLVLVVWNIFYVDALKTRTLFLIFSFTGLALSYFLVHLLARQKTPKSSLQTILETFHLTPKGLTLRESSVKTVSAISTIVFGGSAGPEGPSAVMGGGLSIWLSSLFKTKMDAGKALLIGVGAAISASFKTPLTGVLFALELPYRRDLEKEPFIEGAIASSVAYLVSVAMGSPPLLPHLALDVPEVPLSMLPLAMAFGLATSGVVYLFTKCYHAGEAAARVLMSKGGYPLMLIVGGLGLGVVGYLSPVSIGPGYQMTSMLESEAVLPSLLLALSLRMLSTTFTLNFGGSGGLILPTLVMGGAWGAVLSQLFPALGSPVFVLMGMAAFTAGVHKMMFAPVVFVAEIFGAHTMIPVILATVVCYFLSGSAPFHHVQPLNKVYEEELALERLYYRVMRSRPTALVHLKAGQVMTPDPMRLRSDMSVREAFEVFSRTPFRLMPVVDADDVLMGYVTLEDLSSLTRTAMDGKLKTAGLRSALAFGEDDGLVRVIESMIEREVDHSFVVDDGNQLTGIISSIDIVRILLRQYTQI